MKQITQRLFFALWPDTELQSALWHCGQRMRKALRGRAVSADNIHLTLAFLGSVPVDATDELLAIGASIRARSFHLDLAETGCWKRSAVGWIAPNYIPPPLAALVLKLREQLAAAGFSIDAKPFAPHVTLLRKARCTTPVLQPDAPLVWSVDRFVLVHSETLKTGPVYTRTGMWSLD